MDIVEIDTTQGDLKLLAMTVQALIESHPDKEAFLKAFKKISEDPREHSLYAPKGSKPSSTELIMDILRTASSCSQIKEEDSNA